MTRLTGNNGGLFRKTTATGLVLLLLLFLLPSCAARHMPDWSRVQAVPPKTKTDVHLYKDEAHQGSRKIKGRFDSAAADSITLKLKDGQTRTLEKQAVRKVLTRRPFSKRKPGWIALGVAFAITEFFPPYRPTTHSLRKTWGPRNNHPPDRSCIFLWLADGRDLRSPAQAQGTNASSRAVRCPGQSSRKGRTDEPVNKSPNQNHKKHKTKNLPLKVKT